MIRVTVIERESLRSYEYDCLDEDHVKLILKAIETYRPESDVVIERTTDSDLP